MDLIIQEDCDVDWSPVLRREADNEGGQAVEVWQPTRQAKRAGKAEGSDPIVDDGRCCCSGDGVPNAVTVGRRKCEGLKRARSNVAELKAVRVASVDGVRATLGVRRKPSGVKNDGEEALGSAVNGYNLMVPRTLRA